MRSTGDVVKKSCSQCSLEELGERLKDWVWEKKKKGQNLWLPCRCDLWVSSWGLG